MNASTSWFRFPRRVVGWMFACVAASLLIATIGVAAQSGGVVVHEGASPYTPTKGEWLCVNLNSRQALINSELARSGVGVRYLYDVSKPDSIQIEVLFCQGTRDEQVKRWGALVPHPVGQFRAGFHMPEAIPYIVHLRSLRAKMRESREPDAALAKLRATEAAKVHGWQNWLTIELREQKVVGLDASDVSMQ